MLPRSFLPFFSKIERYVFAFVILLYPILVLVKNNLAYLVAIFVLLLFSGLIHALVNQAYIFDTAIVFIIWSVGLLGFKTFSESWKSKDGKKAWNRMGLGFMVFVLMWFCLQLLAASEEVVT